MNICFKVDEVIVPDYTMAATPNSVHLIGVKAVFVDIETPPWFIDILCDNRDGLESSLKEHGIGTRRFYPPLHSEPVYGYNMSFPVAEEISARGLWLPSSIKVTDAQIVDICEVIRKFYNNTGNEHR